MIGALALRDHFAVTQNRGPMVEEKVDLSLCESYIIAFQPLVFFILSMTAKYHRQPLDLYREGQIGKMCSATNCDSWHAR